jgi:hypothetical protein
VRAAAAICFLAIAGHSATAIRVACGGPGGVDPAGNVWAPDSGYTGGANWPALTSTAADKAAMAAQPVPHNHMRYSSPAGAPIAYNFSLPGGSYDLHLWFEEPRTAASSPPAAAGQRLFTVTINGQARLVDLDVFAEAGSLTPLEKIFPVVSTGPQLQIVLTPSRGNALITAIQIDQPNVAPPSTDGTVGIKCVQGIVKFTDLTADAPSQEIKILDQVPGNTRWEQITVSEHTRFMGRTGVTVGLSVSAGRPGSNNYELTGTQVPLEVSSWDTNMWTARPAPPQLLNAYDVVLNFSATPGNVNLLTAGELLWEACTYLAPAAPIAAAPIPQKARLASVKQCSGSGPGDPHALPFPTLPWDCDKLLWANITLADGTPLNIVGIPMLPPAAAPVTWTDK